MSSSDQKETEPTAEFPIAEVRKRANPKQFLVSKTWWVTLVCALVAFILAGRSMQLAGPKITIEFPQGHGLKAGDGLRHRGIDVGIVQTAALRPDLSGIQVIVELNPEAEILCREGSRFWVVRPHVGMAGIEGLETVVGARYIAVSPGASDATEQRSFDGLAVSPPDEFAAGGLELILRADTRSGLNPGAPVTWRGVQVGQVLSVGLSLDAKHVNATITISAGYRRLVTTNSKFWVTSGLGVHVGLSGIDLNADSLASLVLGGVSFITPTTETPAGEIRSGHLFPLHPSVDDSWLENAAAIPLIDVDLPETVSIEGTVTTSFLGIKRRIAFSATGVLLRVGESVSLLTANLPVEAGDDGEQIPELRVRLAGADEPITIPPSEVSEDWEQNAGVLLMDFPGDAGIAAVQDTNVLRNWTTPEECCVIRTLFNAGHTSAVVHTLAIADLSVRDRFWQVSDANDADLSAWNGAPVVSLSDGRIVGVLRTTEQGTAVVPIPAYLVE